MPPQPGQKGTGKKGRDAARQSRSRNSTPGSSFPLADTHTAFLDLPIKSFRTSDDLNETYGTTIPSSKDLEALLERLNKLTDVVDTRGTVCDRGMRLLSQARKDRLEEIENERRDEERKEQLKKDAADEEERGRNKMGKIKKRKDLSTAREERPLTHGAHGLAPQDGSNLGTCPEYEAHLTVTNIYRRSHLAYSREEAPQDVAQQRFRELLPLTSRASHAYCYWHGGGRQSGEIRR